MKIFRVKESEYSVIKKNNNENKSNVPEKVEVVFNLFSGLSNIMKENYSKNKENKLKSEIVVGELSERRRIKFEKKLKRQKLIGILNKIITFFHFLFITFFAILTIITSISKNSDYNNLIIKNLNDIHPYNYESKKFENSFITEIFSSIKKSNYDKNLSSFVLMSPMRFNFVN